VAAGHKPVQGVEHPLDVNPGRIHRRQEHRGAVWSQCVGLLYNALRRRPSQPDRLLGAPFRRSLRWSVLSALACRENGRESEDETVGISYNE
jgi:hypothetical protein